VLSLADADPACRTFVIEVAGEPTPVGFGVLHRDGADLTTWPDATPHVLLRGLTVDARWQGRGVGAAAVAAVPELTSAWFPDALHVVLTVHTENAAGLRVYDRAGFTRTDAMYAGRAGPEYVMALPLP